MRRHPQKERGKKKKKKGKKRHRRERLTLSFSSILTGIPSQSSSRILMTTSVTVWSGKTPVVLPLSVLVTFGILTDRKIGVRRFESAKVRKGALSCSAVMRNGQAGRTDHTQKGIEQRSSVSCVGRAPKRGQHTAANDGAASSWRWVGGWVGVGYAVGWVQRAATKHTAPFQPPTPDRLRGPENREPRSLPIRSPRTANDHHKRPPQTTTNTTPPTTQRHHHRQAPTN